MSEELKRLRELQLLLNKLVRRYFSVFSHSLYIPIWVPSYSVILGAGYAKKLNALLDYDLGYRSHWSGDTKISSLEMARILAAGFCYLRQQLGTARNDIASVGTTADFSISKIDEGLYEKDFYFSPVKKAIKYACASFGTSVRVCVFGSVQDRCVAKGYSDMDTLIILGGELVSNAMALHAMRRKVIKQNVYPHFFNTLHHHDPFYLTELDFDFYPESVFPLTLLPYTSVMNGGAIFGSVIVCEDKNSNKYRLDSRLSKIESKSMLAFDNAWVGMSTMSDYFLIFALMYQYLYKPIYKGKVFTAIEEKLPGFDFEFLKKCSDIRSDIFPKCYWKFQLFSIFVLFHPVWVQRIMMKVSFTPSILKQEWSELFLMNMKSHVNQLKILGEVE